MKIENTIKPGGAQLVNETRGHPNSKAPPTGEDDFKLSGLSTQILASGDEQPFDAVRVSEIKQAISEGRFKINSGAIAERLITSAKELVDSQQQA